MARDVASAITGGRWERFSHRAATAVLAVLFFHLALAGYSTLAGVLSSRWVIENGLLFNKLASEIGGMGVLVAASIGAIVCGWILRGWTIHLRQRRHDSIGGRIMEALRADPEAPVPEFFVFLRAFETTGRLNIPLYLRLLKITAFGHLTPNDMEGYLSGAMRRHGPLIAMGRPGDSYGAGRVTALDQHWREDVLLLLKRARGILLIPSHRPGTRWEIESILDHGFLGKCVLVMPPRSKEVIDTRERWQAAQQSLRELGLELPDYHPSGLLFEFGAPGPASNVEPLVLGSHRALRKCLDRLLSDAPPAGGLFEAIARADRQRRRARLFGWIHAVWHWSPALMAATNFLLPAAPQPPATESWQLTMDRIGAYRAMSDWDLLEPVMLNASAKYRAWRRTVPPTEAENARLRFTVIGLSRLGDEQLRRFYIAQAEMLDRLDAATCAAYATGQMDADALRHALSYIPADKIRDFLHTRTQALLAGLESRPVPSLDQGIREARAMDEAAEHFMRLLTPEQRERWIRFGQDPANASSEDHCWFNRTVFGGVKRLGERDSAAWARCIVSNWLAALAPVQ